MALAFTQRTREKRGDAGKKKKGSPPVREIGERANKRTALEKGAVDA